MEVFVNLSQKKKKVDVAEAIEVLGDKQLESAILMSSALENMHQKVLMRKN